ncbi:MAG: hypothetical protein HY567_01870 [Candidatus Kerfeldbacteria bacterium]|nr:hypothetical protein [Candidatus Kerfeldbacteria bacterium]
MIVDEYLLLFLVGVFAGVAATILALLTPDLVRSVQHIAAHLRRRRSLKA